MASRSIERRCARRSKTKRRETSACGRVNRQPSGRYARTGNRRGASEHDDETVLIRRNRLFARSLAVGLALVGAVAGAQPGSGRVFERIDTDGNDVYRAAGDRGCASRHVRASGRKQRRLRDRPRDRGSARRDRAGVRWWASAPARAGRRPPGGDRSHQSRRHRRRWPHFSRGIHLGRDPLVLRFDGNGDGSITRAEMEEGASQVREAVRRRRGAP